MKFSAILSALLFLIGSYACSPFKQAPEPMQLTEIDYKGLQIDTDGQVVDLTINERTTIRIELEDETEVYYFEYGRNVYSINFQRKKCGSDGCKVMQTILDDNLYLTAIKSHKL